MAAPIIETGVTFTTRRTNSIALMRAWNAPTTFDNLHRLAVQYEGAYRYARTSRRPPTRALLAGMLATARVFHSLAREASR